MSYLRNMTHMYADAWLEINNLEWSPENWTKAIQWVSSHTVKECRDYIKKQLP